jgi:hypothetical protein
MGEPHRDYEVSHYLHRALVPEPAASGRRESSFTLCVPNEATMLTYEQLSVLVYLVAQRHFHSPTLEDLRADVKRTEDVHETALTLTEFIEKKGDELWADELLEGVGPWLMIQLSDMAAFFEVMRKYVFSSFHKELASPVQTLCKDFCLVGRAIELASQKASWQLQ